MRLVPLVIVLTGMLFPTQQTAQPDPEAEARKALARRVTAGSVPFLLPHARYSNVAAGRRPAP
jgi:hypothetical protein